MTQRRDSTKAPPTGIARPSSLCRTRSCMWWRRQIHSSPVRAAHASATLGLPSLQRKLLRALQRPLHPDAPTRRRQWRNPLRAHLCLRVRLRTRAQILRPCRRRRRAVPRPRDAQSCLLRLPPARRVSPLRTRQRYPLTMQSWLKFRRASGDSWSNGASPSTRCRCFARGCQSPSPTYTLLLPAACELFSQAFAVSPADSSVQTPVLKRGHRYEFFV